ncbi:branched-chain amino acid ABC transporter permease [Piscinibacter gummiphilus]|uniref:ABC transporter permease n=1 Tax=Piscinibacter gummiphilus TaxID=946333 RepID=A0A1W6L9Q6_9BURK|nr:branched-chain amino acid ABC transporter permease [Piscinibacter gummiphilus]ARN20992.1 ABC transporter permease [Piscinibacter gummiphilus]ATU65667.1 branched-chain amino acid ABC transporter permease [Piscinibacter gummiphilus]GLS93526.1 branched-chain amino acid ABC transporter permease [Piscinibacter gummiphilus]
MDLTILMMLAQDGIATGAIYVLLALGLVLVFSITRVIFIPIGELMTFAALSLVALQNGGLPQPVWLLLLLGGLCFVFDLVAWRGRSPVSTLLPGALRHVVVPLVLFAIFKGVEGHTLPVVVQVVLVLLLIVPFGAMVYRLGYQPVAEASVLVLLIVSVAVHFVLIGAGLMLFGAEGWRAQPLWDVRFELGAQSVSGQILLVLLATAALITGLFLFFRRSISGKALRAAAVCRRGAQLVGISAEGAGRSAFTLAALIAALCGVLIAPLATVYFDSGFLFGLKGFVGAIFGGLVSYPAAAAGALLVGLLESYASFEASAFKEVIVFGLIVPVLLWRSLTSGHGDDE